MLLLIMNEVIAFWAIPDFAFRLHHDVYFKR